MQRLKQQHCFCLPECYEIIDHGYMTHSKVGEGTRRIARSCKLHLHTIFVILIVHPLCTNYVQCLQYFKYSSTYKYLAKDLSINISTLGKLRKYLRKVQVLSNLYLVQVLVYLAVCLVYTQLINGYLVVILLYNQVGLQVPT